MSLERPRFFLHVDLDAFFASVEQLDHPEYRGKPLIVGGLPGERRSVVSTASYEARVFGVHSAMPVSEAYRRCPQGIFVHGRMERYVALSEQIMDIFRTFSPDVEQMSIDEAFVDLTGTEQLFGSPSATALRLKQSVYQQTGLTVSVGLASNRFVAKIASEVAKPNGFTEVPLGTEEQFMRSRPLEKIWGIGDKTLEHIHSAGLFTTTDVLAKSRDLLCFMFGSAAGAFLFDAVRGRDSGVFSHETKNHSLSAEQTFPFDLTDEYTAETALMDLTSEVMFRLLREKVTSRTVILKIRYGDFSTSTVQESSGEITSADDLYERACRLFEKKYEPGRGIRLLGVSAGNTEAEYIRQEELFDNGVKKKQAVEKAILDLETKHPDVKMKRARQINTGSKIILAALLTYTLCARTLAADDTTSINATGAGSITTGETKQPEPDDSPSPLFNYDTGSANIKFLADGYWQAEFTQTSAATFGYGTPFALSFGVPVFKQKVDLSLFFLLNNKWFITTSFADEFTKNTISAGYHGDGNLKEVFIANRGVKFPSTYSPDSFGKGIGGGTNQAPGISAHFEDSGSSRWRSDIAFRYDMTSQKSATFYGKNKVSDKTETIADYLTGQLFVLPTSDAVSSVSGVYVESSSGSYTDSTGRTYKKLASSDYLLLPARSEIIISNNAGAGRTNGKLPAVVITFDSESSYTAAVAALGTYETASSFLGNIQTYFSQSDASLSVSSYAYDYTTNLNGLYAFIIQSPAGFSPFVCANRYDCGTTGTTDVMISSASTGTVSKTYTAVLLDSTISFTASDFFTANHSYADVSISNYSGASLTDPEVRFPFADKNPGSYLGYTPSNDLEILVRTYTSVSRYDIGTDAVSGSVRVYKNSIIDNSAQYDSESGTVTLSSSAGDTDKIYITWDEDNGTANNGAVAGSAAFAYDWFPGFTSDIALATRWAVSPYQHYADASYAQTGYALLSSGTTYAYSPEEDSATKFTASDAGAVSVESQNTTGRYHVLGMDDGSTQTYYLTQSSGASVPSGIVPVLNDRTFTSYTELSGSNTGSYGTGVSDSAISGYAVPVMWSFSDSATERSWAAAEITLSQGTLLSSGTEFRIAIKNTAAFTDADVYLQLGVDAAATATTGETTTSVPTWKISESGAPDVIQNLDTSVTGWKTVIVTLRGSDRARLTSAHDARIIIVKKTAAGSGAVSGTLSAGPYETAVQPVFLSNDAAYTVTSEEYADSTVPGASDFNAGTNYAAVVTWRGSSSVPSSAVITTAKYFTAVDLSSYTSVSLAFCYTAGEPYSAAQSDDEGLSFTLDRDAESVDQTGKTALRAVITKAALAPYVSSDTSLAARSWHTLSVDIPSRTVSIDGQTLAAGTYSVTADTSIIPTRVRLSFTTAPGGTILKTGVFCFDELALDGASPYFLFQHFTKFSYKKNGVVAQAGSVPLVEDISLGASATESGTVHSKTNASSGRIASTGNAGITLLSINFGADASIASDETSLLTNAGHHVATVRPLFGMISLSETYRYNHADETLEKNNTASLSFSPLHIPLTVSAHVSSSENEWAFKQDSGAETILSAGINGWSCSLAAKAGVTQKIVPSVSNTYPVISNYFSGWKDATLLSVSGGSESASVRTISGEGKISTGIPFLSLAPSFTCSIGGNHTSSSSVLFTDTSKMVTAIPFTVGLNSFTLQWTKTGTGSLLSSKGGTYEKDCEQLGSALSERRWYFSSAPFYDLFSTELSDAVLADTAMTATSADSLAYSTQYSIAWNRPLFGTTADFYVPSGLSFAVSRDIRTSASVSDFYQLKATALQTAFNIFGDGSSLRFFRWYDQDEFTSSFTGAVKIPRTEPASTTFQTTAYTQANLYITDTDVWKNGFEIDRDTSGNWSARITTAWKRPGKVNPAASLIQVFFKSFEPGKTKLTRTDSADVTFSSASSVWKQIYALSHAADLKIFSYFTINYGIAGTFTFNQKAASQIAVVLTLGGKAEF